MAVTDPVAKADNTFLHVTQVGLKKEFSKMIPAQLIRKDGREGTKFTYNGVEYTILFDPANVPGGSIRTVKNGKVLYDRPFSREVQKQRAFDYLK